MELSATAKVILGMLSARPRSGYEIKQLVDSSARFFWAASYGQIYPELKKLEKDGLIAGDDSSQGGRQRTTFKLTAKGRRAAREWIAGAPEVLETRDEGLLMLFFAGSIESERAAEIARERAATARQKAAELRAIADQVEETGTPQGVDAQPDAGSLTVLRYGIEMSEWAAEWFERAAEDLETDTAAARLGAGRG
ncbi:MAG TPA: PadR family transcriptional regulator [Solirubrobacterales bacterium]|jgi:DNA-binding PadR family transcriptional regulator